MEALTEVQQLQAAIENQTEINRLLTIAELEKTRQLARQLDVTEKDRISRDHRTDAIESMILQVTELTNTLRELLNKRRLENIEQLFEVIVPILSQVSVALGLKDHEIGRLIKLISSIRTDININSGANTNIKDYKNQRGSVTNIRDSENKNDKS